MVISMSMYHAIPCALMVGGHWAVSVVNHPQLCLSAHRRIRLISLMAQQYMNCLHSHRRWFVVLLEQYNLVRVQSYHLSLLCSDLAHRSFSYSLRLASISVEQQAYLSSANSQLLLVLIHREQSSRRYTVLACCSGQSSTANLVHGVASFLLDSASCYNS